MAPKKEGRSYKRHNSIALLSATDRGDGYEEIINYLVRSPIAYSLRVDPDLRRGLISEFWKNASIVKTETFMSIKTTVGGKQLIITEDIVRAVLQFQDHIDADDYMDEKVIFGCFRQMGYSGRLASIQFKKPHMPVLYRFLMHTVIMCLSPWKGGYDALDRRGQALMVSLVFNRPYNFSRFIFNNMVANVKHKTFDQYPRFVQLFIDQGLPNLPYHGLVEKAVRIDPRYFMDCKRNGVDLALQGALLDSAYQAPDIHAYDHLVGPDSPRPSKSRGSVSSKSTKSGKSKKVKDDDEEDVEEEEEEEVEESEQEADSEETVELSTATKNMRDSLSELDAVKEYVMRRQKILEKGAKRGADMSNTEDRASNKGKQVLVESSRKSSPKAPPKPKAIAFKDPVQSILPSQPLRSFRSKNASTVDIQPPPLTQSPPPSSTKRTRTITSPNATFIMDSPQVPPMRKKVKKRMQPVQNNTMAKKMTKLDVPTAPKPSSSDVAHHISRQEVHIDATTKKMEILEAVMQLAEEKGMLEAKLKMQDEVIAKQKEMFEEKIQMQDEVNEKQQAMFDLKMRMQDEVIAKQKTMFVAQIQMQDKVIAKQKAMFEARIEIQDDVIVEQKEKLQIQEEVAKQKAMFEVKTRMVEAAKLQHEKLISLIIKSKIAELKVKLERGNPDHEVVRSTGIDIKYVMDLIPESLRVNLEARFSSMYEGFKSLFLTHVDDSQWEKIESELKKECMGFLE